MNLKNWIWILRQYDSSEFLRPYVSSEFLRSYDSSELEEVEDGFYQHVLTHGFLHGLSWIAVFSPRPGSRFLHRVFLRVFEGKCIVVKLRQAGYERVLDFVVTEDAKLDVGTISRSFGLNPSSLKFNDIYVSRGPDFISSVTWSNLTASLNPILVEDKPCEPYGMYTYPQLSYHSPCLDAGKVISFTFLFMSYYLNLE